MPRPRPREKDSEFIQRCMGDAEMLSEYPEQDQRYVVCQSKLKTYGEIKISFDYDGVASTEKGKELIKNTDGNIYIISARSERSGMLKTAKELNIPISKVFATGSNKAKVEKIKSLGITKHYDNNYDVIKQLGEIGSHFQGLLNAETYNDYPQAASDNATRAIKLRDENNLSCGTLVGWQRAAQLSKKENISRDTIARMASFERHRQNSKGDPKEDCGALMWLAWGGDEGIAWAQRKLKQIDGE